MLDTQILIFFDPNLGEWCYKQNSKNLWSLTKFTTHRNKLGTSKPLMVTYLTSLPPLMLNRRIKPFNSSSWLIMWQHRLSFLNVGVTQLAFFLFKVNIGKTRIIFEVCLNFVIKKIIFSDKTQALLMKRSF